MAQYIIVLPEGTLTSEKRAKSITRELYNITTPLAVQEPYQKDGTVFGVIVHPDGVQHALQVNTEYVIPVHEQATLEKLVSLFPELTADERFNLASYALNTDEFPFSAIIPSTTTVRDHDYMVQSGWFEIDDI
jgi:hypothetical protein